MENMDSRTENFLEQFSPFDKYENEHHDILTLYNTWNPLSKLCNAILSLDKIDEAELIV